MTPVRLSLFQGGLSQACLFGEQLARLFSRECDGQEFMIFGAVNLTVLVLIPSSFSLMSNIFVRIANVVSMPDFCEAINCSRAKLLITNSMEGKVANVRDTVERHHER